MLTKEEHIAYWKREAERNWETAIYLQKGSQRVMALFMLHLVTEKLLNAHWVKDNIDNQPPRTICKTGTIKRNLICPLRIMIISPSIGFPVASVQIQIE